VTEVISHAFMPRPPSGTRNAQLINRNFAGRFMRCMIRTPGRSSASMTIAIDVEIERRGNERPVCSMKQTLVRAD